MAVRVSLSFLILMLSLFVACDSPPTTKLPSNMNNAEDTVTDNDSDQESDSQSSDDGNQPSSDEDQQDEPSLVNSENNDTPDIEPGTLSTSQERSIDITIDAAKAIAMATVAVLPSKDLPAAIQGLIPLPSCPAVSLEPEFEAVTIMLDYASGCSTSLYPELSLTGNATGLLFFANALDLNLASVTSADQQVEGRVAGGFSGSGSTITFTLSFDLSSDDGLAIRGGSSVTVDGITGQMTFDEGDFSLSDSSSGTVQVSFEGVVFDPAKAGNFRPGSGRVSITGVDPESGENSGLLDIEFTESTTKDESVMILSKH